MNLITESVKTKYPVYAGMDDDDLTLKIAEKFPAYLKQEDFADDVGRIRLHRTPSMQPATGKTPGALTPISPTKGIEQARVEAAAEAIPREAPEALAIHQQLAKPFVPVRPNIAKFYALLPPKAAEVAAGSAEAVADAVSFLESSYGIGAIASSALPGAPGRLVMTAMAADMLIHTPESFTQGVEAYRRGDLQEASRHFVTAGITGLGGVLLGTKGIREARPAAAQVEAALSSEARRDALANLFRSYSERPDVKKAWQSVALTPMTSEAVAEALVPKRPIELGPRVFPVRIEQPVEAEAGLRAQRMEEIEQRIARGREELQAAKISGDEGALLNLRTELEALERERQGLPPAYRPETAIRREEIDLPTVEQRIHGRSLVRTPFSETTYRLAPSEEVLPEVMQPERVPLKTADSAREARLRALYATLGDAKARAATLEAAQRMGAEKAEVARAALDKLLEVGRDKVPLSAAERTIFDQIWDAELERKLAEERAMGGATVRPPGEPPPPPPPPEGGAPAPKPPPKPTEPPAAPAPATGAREEVTPREKKEGQERHEGVVQVTPASETPAQEAQRLVQPPAAPAPQAATKIAELKRQLATEQKKLDKNIAKMGSMVPPPIVAEVTRKIGDRMARIQDQIDALEKAAAPAPKEPAPAAPAAAPAPAAKEELIARIAEAAKESELPVVPIDEIKGSDGKWYSARGGLPSGVSFTGERRIGGYAYRSPEGTIIGQRFSTEEAAKEAQSSKIESRSQKFKEQLRGMSPERLEEQAKYWLKTEPPAAPAKTTAKPRRTRRLPTPQQITDFRPGIDRVERRGNRTFIVDTEGQRAPVEVQHDALTPETEANLRRLPRERLAEFRAQTEATPWLSPEGKAERLKIFDELMGRAAPPPAPPSGPPPAAGGQALGLVAGTPADQWAQRTIREGLGGTSANPFADPRFVAAAIVRGAALLESGVRTFADWSRRMSAELGTDVQPHLSRLWEQAHNYNLSLRTLAMGSEGWFESQVRGVLEGARDKTTQLWMGLKEMANRELPNMLKASPEVQDKAVAYASARPAAKRMAARFWDKVFADRPDGDRVWLHAALIQDRLDGKRAEVQAQAAQARAAGDTEAAANWDIIATGIGDFIGTEGFPFKTREEFNAYLKEPETQRLVARYAALREQEIEPLFQKAAQVEPGEVTPTKGLQTGVFISLVPLTEGRPTRPIYATGTGNLKATLQRPPRHARRFTGLAEGYDLDPDTAIADVYADLYQKATYNDLIESLVNNGLGIISNKRPPSVAGERPSETFPLKYAVRFRGGGGLKQQDFYVPQSLAGEMRKIYNVDKFPTVTHGVNTVLNQVALASLSEFTSHMSNLTSLFTLPGKTGGSLWADTLAKAAFADVPVKLVQSVVRAFNIGKFEDRLIELTKMGATREHWDAAYGQRQVPGLKWTQKAIAIYDDAITTMLDDTFSALVREGRVEDTPANRRAFINQRGQYNLLLQDQLRRLFRKTGFGPFVTAGTAFHIRSLRAATSFGAGVPATSVANDLALRVNVASRWLGVAAVASGLTYLFTGSWLPRKGVPIGAIDSGKDDERGNPLYFDLANWSGLRRGLRVDGVDAFAQAKRVGLSNSEAFNAMARQALNAWISPFAGPPVQALSILTTGKPPGVDLPSHVGPVPPESSRVLAQAGAALREANPVVATVAAAVRGEPLAQTARRQLTKFAPQAGMSEQRATRMPRIIHGGELNRYIDDLVAEARRLPMHQRFAHVVDQVNKDGVTAKDKVRVYQEARKRLMRP